MEWETEKRQKNVRANWFFLFIFQVLLFFFAFKFFLHIRCFILIRATLPINKLDERRNLLRFTKKKNQHVCLKLVCLSSCLWPPICKFCLNYSTLTICITFLSLNTFYLIKRTYIELYFHQSITKSTKQT